MTATGTVTSSPRKTHTSMYFKQVYLYKYPRVSRLDMQFLDNWSGRSIHLTNIRACVVSSGKKKACDVVFWTWAPLNKQQTDTVLIHLLHVQVGM